MRPRFWVRFAPEFTIRDREDSADLLNLIRHELGYSETESGFLTKSTAYVEAKQAQSILEPAEFEGDFYEFQLASEQLCGPVLFARI